MSAQHAAATHHDLDDKHMDIQIERPQHTVDVNDSSTEDLYKSRYDRLSVFQALWTFRRSTFYAFLVFTGYTIDGFEVTMTGSIVSNKGFIQQFGEADATGAYALSATWVGAWGAIINVGQIVAMTHVGWVADRFGRRMAMWVSWVYAIVSCIVMATAKSDAAWLIGKLLMGAAIGTLQVTVFPWTTESTPTRCRGSVMMLGRIWYAVGGICASLMMNITAKTEPFYWQLPVYVEMGLVGFMGICFLLVPETPWHYGRRGNKEGCFKSFKRLYGNVPDYNMEEEWGIILRSIAHEREINERASSVSWANIFKGTNGKRMWILILVCTGQQVGGNSLISTYSTYFFQLAGLADPFQASMIQNCVALIAIIFYFVAIDRIGRRLPTCTTYSLLTVVLWIIGALYYVSGTAAQNALLALVCIWQPCFTLYTTSYYVIASELPSAELRMKTGTFVWFYQALWGIVLTFVAPILIKASNVRAGFLYGGLSVPVAILLWFYLPETKARSVAEMDELFEKRIPAWRTNGYVTDVERQWNSVLEMEQKAN